MNPENSRPLHADQRANALISIVIPMYNETACLSSLFDQLLPVMETVRHRYEIICVDDGSSDDTVNDLRCWQSRIPDLNIISLSRNFGKESALACGLDHARGDAVIPLDADLQDPPELIVQLVDKWREGYDMVVATRRNRPGDSKLKRNTASCFYKTMNRFSEVELPPHAGDFRLLDRKVVNALKDLPENTRFHKGLYAWVGFSTFFIEFERPARSGGTTSWGYWKLWNYALDGIFSFSTAPLRLWSYMGVATACAGFIYAAYIIFRTLLLGIDVPGYASLLVLLLVTNGSILVGIGVVGEYVGRVFSEVKNRPLYIVNSIEPAAAESRVLDDKVVRSVSL
ncbi:MAG: glycosyltransferase family 2 protein [Pseudomonadales bacterium]